MTIGLPAGVSAGGAGSSSAGDRTYSACCQPSRPMRWRKYDSR